MKIRLTLMAVVACSLLFTNLANGQQVIRRQPWSTVKPDPSKSLFENAAAALQKNFVHKEFREQKLPGIVERYRPLAEAAETLNDQRQVVHDMLSEIPATHLGLLSKSTREHMTAELFNQPKPTLGFQLIEKDGKHFAHQILEGGPAENAQLLRGDRILLIDGKLPSLSPRLDWRSDDAFLIDDPVRGLICEESEIVHLLVERKPGETIELEVKATPYCAYDAAKHSARIIESQGKKIAHIHFWMIHITGVPELLKEKLDGEFKDCDALVLDLRGRGGNGAVLQAIYNVLSGKTSTWDKPVVALVDRNSRSAKEVIAYDLQQLGLGLIVGDRTAGAVIPASMADVGHDTMLMYPTFKFGKKTDVLELKGVTPDVLVQDAGPYAAGVDPIRDAGIREAVRLAESDASQPEAPSTDGSNDQN